MAAAFGPEALARHRAARAAAKAAAELPLPTTKSGRLKSSVRGAGLLHCSECAGACVCVRTCRVHATPSPHISTVLQTRQRLTPCVPTRAPCHCRPRRRCCRTCQCTACLACLTSTCAQPWTCRRRRLSPTQRVTRSWRRRRQRTMRRRRWPMRLCGCLAAMRQPSGCLGSWRGGCQTSGHAACLTLARGRAPPAGRRRRCVRVCCAVCLHSLSLFSHSLSLSLLSLSHSLSLSLSLPPSLSLRACVLLCACACSCASQRLGEAARLPRTAAAACDIACRTAFRACLSTGVGRQPDVADGRGAICLHAPPGQQAGGGAALCAPAHAAGEQQGDDAMMMAAQMHSLQRAVCARSSALCSSSRTRLARCCPRCPAKTDRGSP